MIDLKYDRFLNKTENFFLGHESFWQSEVGLCFPSPSVIFSA